MQSTLLAPEPQVDESAVPTRRSFNLTAPAAVLVGVAALATALFSDSTLAAGALAVLGVLLGISALTRSSGRRSRLVAGVVALGLSLGSVGSLVVLDKDSASPAGQMAIQSEVANSPVELTFGAVAVNAENKSTSVTVTVTNVSDHTVSTWASISATSPDGTKTYASQGVGVRELEPGQSSTQQITFGSVLPADAVFVVKDVL